MKHTHDRTPEQKARLAALLEEDAYEARAEEHGHLDYLAAIICLDEREEPIRGYDPIQRCDLCEEFDSDEAAARAVAIQRFGTDGDVLAVLYTDHQPFVLQRSVGE